jgi:hypothetical protein
MKIKLVLLTIGLLFLNGCATSPNKEKLASMPVIEFGRSVPADGNYILHFPAGRDIPTNVGIEGDLFAQPGHDVLKVRLNRDIYTHRQWVSYNNKDWFFGPDVMQMKVDIKIPGYDYPQPGHITVNLSSRK